MVVAVGVAVVIIAVVVGIFVYKKRAPQRRPNVHEFYKDEFI